MIRILVIGEGSDEIGERWGEELSIDDLPALPELIRRTLSHDAISFVCREWRCIGKTRGGIGTAYTRKVKQAIAIAYKAQYDAVVVLIDRDRDAKRILQLRAGRDEQENEGPIYKPCAVGTAVETFDAWMICDEQAVEKAEGNKKHAHPDPEKLTGKEKQDDGEGHPKTWAGRAFDGKIALGKKYRIVARHLNLDRLQKVCSKGFAPFAKEVQERIGSLVSN